LTQNRFKRTFSTAHPFSLFLHVVIGNPFQKQENIQPKIKDQNKNIMCMCP